MYLSTFMGPASLSAAQDGPLIDQCLDLAERAASAGFAMVTFGEQHFSNYEPYTNPLLMAARLSPSLGETWFGTTIVPLPFHGVLRLAEDSSVVDVLTRGRFILGMSSGRVGFGSDFPNFGIDPERRQEVFDSKLDLLLAAYRRKLGDPPLSLDTEWDSGVFAGRMTPVPFRLGGPRIAVGTSTDTTIDEVAKRKLALFLGPCLPSEAAAKLARHRAGLTAAGLDQAAVDALAATSLVTRHVIVGATEDEAWDLAEKMGGSSPLINRREDTRSLQEMAAVPAEAAAQDPHPRNVHHVHSWFLVGTPDSVVTQLRQYGELGVRHVNVRFTVGTYRPEAVDRSFGLFVKEAMPALDPQLFPGPTVEETSPEHRSDADIHAVPASQGPPRMRPETL